MLKSLIAFLILLISCPVAYSSELTWEETKLSRNTELGQKEASFVFKFKNSSHETVKITKILSSCGCTTTDFETKTIRSQESGELKAVVQLKGIKGLKASTIKVYLNNQQSPSYTLSVKVDVPSPITISPIFLTWKRNEDRKAKEIKVTIHPQFDGELRNIEIPNKSSLLNSKCRKTAR